MVGIKQTTDPLRRDQSRRVRVIILGVALVIAGFVLTEVRADAELDREVNDLAERMEAHIGADASAWAREIAMDLLAHPDRVSSTRAAAELRAVAGSDASLFTVETVGQSDDIMAVFRATSWWRERCATMWVLGGFVSWNESACP